ncbi:MAG: hypothetical protein Q8O84_03445 [Nanoarchaeota archaeon]|nr:hypothetical protein [Nanoarchaeota archaeon]
MTNSPKRGRVKEGRKKGQLTIFIIVAILVVAIVALLFAIPKLRTAVGFEKPQSPENFIQTCLEDTIKENVELISSQGGSLEPEPSILYQDNKLQYLCYSNEYYKPCIVQIPFLRNHIEDEIKKSIEEDVKFCFNSLKENYEKANYQTSLKTGETIVELLPNKILTTINNEFTFSKADETQRRETFRVILNNNLYELTAIAQNIIEWETIYGGADPDSYMDVYSNLKVEKYPQTDDTTIYILTDKNTDDKFQFASRSLAFAPAG